MNFLFVILIFCFFFFLYVTYLLSHDDFVILRRDVSMEKIFNAAFLSSFVALFSARLIYVLFHPNNLYFHILGFLLFPYFPGLSLTGGVLGGFGFAAFYLKSRKMPIGRVMDFFSFGFLTTFPLGIALSLLISRQKLSANFIFPVVLFVAIFIVFLKFVLPRSLGGKLRDGSLTLLFLISFSGFYFIINMLNGRFFLDEENIFLIVTFFAALVSFLQYETVDKLIFQR